jgi:hypothetical protein
MEELDCYLENEEIEDDHGRKLSKALDDTTRTSPPTGA